MPLNVIFCHAAVGGIISHVKVKYFSSMHNINDTGQLIANSIPQKTVF